MSIGKVGTVKSSASAVDYVLKERKGEKPPKLIGGNALGSTIQEIKDEFHHQEALNFKVRNKVIHIVISFPKNAEMTDERAAEYADRVMEKLGYGSNLYIVVRHFDKEDRQEDPYAHLHIVGSRIRDDGTPITEWKSAERVIVATKEIDEEMGIESVPFVKNEEERNIKKDEYRVMQKRKELSVMEKFKDVAKETLSEINNIDPLEDFSGQPRKINLFVAKIQQAGFEVLPSFDEETEEMRGFSFKKDRVTFTARTGWKSAKWERLKETVGYQADRDHKFLVDLKENVSADSAAAATVDMNSSREANKIAERTTEKTAQPVEEIFTKPAEDNRNLIETNKRQITELIKDIEVDSPASATGGETEPNTVRPKIEEVQINEKTIESATGKSKFEPVGNGEKNPKTAKAETEATKTPQILAGGAAIESDSGLGATEIERTKSAAARNSRNDDAPARGGKFTVENATGATAIGGRIGAENRGTDNSGESNAVATANPNSIEDRGAKRVGPRDSRSGSDQESARREGEGDQKTDRKNEPRITRFSSESQPVDAGLGSRLGSGENTNFGNRDAEERAVENGNLELRQGNLLVASKGQEPGQSSLVVSPNTGEGKRSGSETRTSVSEVGTAAAGHSIGNRRVSAADRFDNRLQMVRRDQREPTVERSIDRFAGEEATGHRRNESSISTDFSRPQGDGERSTDIPGGATLLRPAGHDSDETLRANAGSNRQAAEATIQIINVRHFSGQLDSNIVAKWTAVVESLNAKEFLKQVAEPKTEEENETHLTHLIKQSEMIAESLNLPKPDPGTKSDAESLAQTLVSIETANFEAATGRAISDKAFERLLEDRCAVLDELPTAEQRRAIEKQFAEYAAAAPVFSSKMEIEVFNALLDPEAVEFDAARIIETQEKVGNDEIAAVETATLIQIAYGGQPDVFTDEFKAALAEAIYMQPEPATNSYNDFRNFDWQNTINQFSGIVGVLAEEYQVPLLTPPDDVQRNDLLTDFFAESLIDSYQEANNPAERFVKIALVGMAVGLSGMDVPDEQMKMFAQNMPASLKPPVFENALEAVVYNFGKGDSATRTEQSEKIIGYVYQAEQNRIEEQVEIDKQSEEQVEIEGRQSQSSGLAM